MIAALCRRLAPPALLGLVIAAHPVQAQPPSQDSGQADCPQDLRYTFSWSLDGSCGFSPRGGSSTGAPVTLDREPSPSWLALQEPELSQKERDRRAILAMAGEFRANFEFLEIVGYTPDYQRSRPYQSWTTEMVFPLEAGEDFISLQHLMVIFAKSEDGTLQGPFVQKHWRQDWQYEKPQILGFSGHDTWTHQDVPTDELSGSWAQSVYQVDDSPRYEGTGHWRHYPNFSTWISDTTWRPLPRRESSVRQDYQVLEGTNRHTITPTGWVHEEENYKLALDANGEPAAAMPYLSKELGVNRYERIKDFDFEAGADYWERTGPYWEDVRALWQDVFAAGNRITVREQANGTPLFAVLFEQAEVLTENAYDSAKARETLRTLLQDYVD